MKALLFLCFIALVMIGLILYRSHNHNVPVQTRSFDLGDEAFVAPADPNEGDFGPSRARPQSKPQLRSRPAERLEDHWHVLAEIDSEEHIVKIPVAIVPEGATSVTVDFKVLRTGQVKVVGLTDSPNAR